MKKTESKRVCMIVQATFPQDTRVLRMADVLCNAGYYVDIISLRGDKDRSLEHHGKITTYRILKDYDQESFAKYLIKSILFFITAFYKLQLLDSRNEYDLLHIHNMPDHLIFLTIIQKLRGTPVILDLHDLTVELFNLKWNKKRLRLLLFMVKKIEFISCKFATHVITTSDGFVQRLTLRGVPREKITLIHNTPSARFFSFNNQRDYRLILCNAVLLYYGSIMRRFGIHNAIQAMPLIIKSIPGTKLFLFGEYDLKYKRELITLVEDLDLNSSVVFDGFLPVEQLMHQINLSDFGLVPYSDNEFMNLALSTKTFEYCIAGIPIIASRLKSIEGIFSDDCISFVRPDVPKDLAEQIIYLCQNPQIRKNKVENARLAISDISWEIMAKKYNELIDNLIYQMGKSCYN